MRRLTVLALILMLLGATSIARASGPLEEAARPARQRLTTNAASKLRPIEESARRAAQRFAQLQGQSSNKYNLLVGGAGLALAGVVLFILRDAPECRQWDRSYSTSDPDLERDCVEYGPAPTKPRAWMKWGGWVWSALGAPWW